MILITGGAGFIGSHLAERMQRKGVRILDNLASGNLDNIRTLDVEFVKGNIKNRKIVENAMKDVNGIFHLAAHVSPPRSVRMPLFDMRTNILGTLNLLEAARKADVEHFIFSSSSAVYGDTLKVPVSEDIVPMPKSPYGVGKHTCEHYCRVYHTLYGMKTVSLRYFNVYGERQDPTSPYSAVVARFLHNARRNVPLEIHGSGSQIRDFIYVKDVVEANLCAMKSSQWGISLNIGTGKSVSILTLARAILKMRDVGIVHRKKREGDIRVSVADTRLAKKILGFTAKTRLADGLSRLWVHGD